MLLPFVSQFPEDVIPIWTARDSLAIQTTPGQGPAS